MVPADMLPSDSSPLPPAAPLAIGAHTLSHRTFLRILIAISIGGTLLRFVRLGSQSLWIDEVLSYGWIAEINTRGFRSLLHDIHGPIQAIAIWLTSHVSTSEWWLRLPSAIAGALAIPAIGLLGRSLWGPGVGLLVAALLAVSPFALYYSQECRNYAFSILFAVLTTGAALAWWRRPGPRQSIALCVAELASVFSNLNGLFFVIGLALWGLLQLRRRRAALATWTLAHAVVALLLVPYAWEIKHQVRPERLVGVVTPGFGEAERLRGETTLHPLAVPYTAFAFASGYSLGPTLEELREDPGAAARPRYWPILIGIGLAFGVPLLVGIWRGGGGPGRGLLVAPALSTLLFTIWLAAANMKPFNARYLSVLLPAFLLFVALGMWRLPRRWGVAVIAVALLLDLVSCWNYLFVPRYGRDDVRGAVAYVAAHASPDDAILQISLTGSMRYYYNQLGKRPVHPPAEATASFETAQAYLDETVPGRNVVWYLECRPQGIDPRHILRKTLESRARSSEVTDFTGIRVHRYEMALAASATPDSSRVLAPR